MSQTSREESAGPDVPAVVVHLRAMTEAFYALGQDFAALHDLHPTDVQALLHLAKAETTGTPVTPGHLGEALGLASGSVTGLVDRLEHAGHVRRVRDVDDRRRTIIAPTEHALHAGRNYWGALDDAIARSLGRYGPDALATVERFLTEMTILATETARTHRAGPSDR